MDVALPWQPTHQACCTGSAWEWQEIRLDWGLHHVAALVGPLIHLGRRPVPQLMLAPLPLPPAFWHREEAGPAVNPAHGDHLGEGMHKVGWFVGGEQSASRAPEAPHSDLVAGNARDVWRDPQHSHTQLYTGCARPGLHGASVPVARGPQPRRTP